MNEPSSVVQPWVEALPWKMQSVLFSAMRGPDGVNVPGIKRWVRWLRSMCQRDADPATSFMRGERPEPMETLGHELEVIPVHAFAHLMHALEIVGVYRPSELAETGYIGMVEFLHLQPEPTFLLRSRLSDSSEAVSGR